MFEALGIFLVASAIGVNVMGLKIMGRSALNCGPSLRVNVRNYL